MRGLVSVNRYQEADSAALIHAKTIKAAQLISAIYLYHGIGGYAHHVVEHWKLQDADIEECLQRATENKYQHSSEQVRAAVSALEALKELSKEQRYSALALHYGYLQG